MFAIILFYVNPFINKFMYDTYLFLLVPYYLPWEKDVALPLKKKLNSLHPSMLYAKFGSGGEAFLNFVKWLLLSPLGKGCCPSFEQFWIHFTQGNFSKESALSKLHLHLCCYLKFCQMTVIISPWKRVLPLIWIILNPLHTRQFLKRECFKQAALTSLLLSKRSPDCPIAFLFVQYEFRRISCD